MVDQRNVFLRAAEQNGAPHLFQRDSGAVPFRRPLLVGGREHRTHTGRLQKQTAAARFVKRLFGVPLGVAGLFT